MSERLTTFKWAFTTKKQTAYATPLADGDLTKTHALLGPGDVEEEPVVLSDAEEAGRGTEWASLQSIERWHTGARREGYGTPELLGWLCAYWFGSVVTTQPDVGQAPLVYEHEFRVLRPPTTALPVTTIVELGASALRRKVESVVVSTLDIALEDNPGRLKVAADLVGSGKVTLPGSFTFPAAPAESQVFFRSNVMTSTINNVAVTTRLRSFRVRLDNALLVDAAYEPGSGVYRSTIEYGARRPLSFEFTLLADTSGGELTTLRAGTVLTPNSIVFDGTDTINGILKQKLTITIPKIVLTKVVVSDEDGRRVYGCTAEINDDQAAASPINIKVRNANAAYLN